MTSLEYVVKLFRMNWFAESTVLHVLHGAGGGSSDLRIVRIICRDGENYEDVSLSDSEFDEKNWADSAVDVLQLDDNAGEREFWRAVSPEKPTGLKLVPWVPSELPESPEIPGGLSPHWYQLLHILIQPTSVPRNLFCCRFFWLEHHLFHMMHFLNWKNFCPWQE